MTYCVAMRLESGLVFLSDSRTNAGVDQIGTARKMTVFDRPGDRMMVLMSAGNLAIAQAVLQILEERQSSDSKTVWSAVNLHEAAQLVGDAVREVRARDEAALKQAEIEFSVTFIFGGQIRGERTRLFLIYAAGNFVESHDENPYFQIGESKYGKPVLDRMVNPHISLDEGAKCALVSMDSTLRSNISVGLPLDLLVYEKDALAVTRYSRIDHKNAYFHMIHETWGQRLKQVFSEIPDPEWNTDKVPDGMAGPRRAQMPSAIGAQPARELAEHTDSVLMVQSLAQETAHRPGTGR